MKILILPISLVLGLSACNEGSRETTEPPQNTPITENRYKAIENQALDAAEQADTQAPSFRFSDSFTTQDSATATKEMASPPEVSAEKPKVSIPVTEATSSETPPRTTQTQKTANVVNLPKNDTLNVRKRAGTNNPILEKLAPNSKVIITGESKTTKDGQRWFEIITQKKTTGWVNTHYLKRNK